MLKSVLHKTDNKEFELIRSVDHIAKVRAKFRENIPQYLDKMITIAFDDPEIAKLQSFGRITIGKPEPSSVKYKLEEKFELGYRQHFQKENHKYKEVLDIEYINEFQEGDPKSFKDYIRTHCPIIHRCCMSPAEELKKWRESFNYTPAQEILDTVANIVIHINQFSEKVSPKSYVNFTGLEDFSSLLPLSQKEYYVSNVIGTGIQSIFAFHLNPSFFALAIRRAFYGFFFLTSEEDFNLPSKMSEFLIVDDMNNYSTIRGSKWNYKMDHNYWYSYDLFMTHSKFVYDQMHSFLNAKGVTLSPYRRYIDLYTFLDFVCDQHSEQISTMVGKDQSEILS